MNGTLARFVREVSLRAAWFPTLVFVGHVVGMRVGAYAHWPYFDKFTHFMGGLAIAYFFFEMIVIANEVGLQAPTPREILFERVVTLSVTAAVLWEFAEFLSDRYLDTRLQGGVPDTMSDLLMGLLGALLFAFSRAARRRR